MIQIHHIKCSIVLFAAMLMFACFASKEVTKAKEFIEAGMFDQATILLKQEVQSNPKNAEAHMLLGIAYLGSGMSSLAEQELNTAILLDNNLQKEASRHCYNIAKQVVKNDKLNASAALMKAKEYDPSLEKDEQFFYLAYIDTEVDDMARMEASKKYLTLFPSGKYVAQATYELAEGLMSSDRKQAKIYFTKLASQYPETEWGKKASEELTNWIETKDINVPAQEFWFDTGVTLTKGSSLKIDASGRWANVGNNYFDANGTGGTYPGTVLESANLGTLIGKIGDIKFIIGRNYSGTSLASGKLFVTMNDVPGTYDDNSGDLNVQISFGSK